jgi:hypothetical protein
MKHILETEFPVCNSAEEIKGRIFEIWRRIIGAIVGYYQLKPFVSQK